MILFHPFRDESKEIHEKDVKDLEDINKVSIQSIRNIFEKHKVMSDVIFALSRDTEEKVENDNQEDENEEQFMEEETTSTEDIEKFEKWAKIQAKKTISHTKDLTNIVDMEVLRNFIINLNSQQRMILMTIVSDY